MQDSYPSRGEPGRLGRFTPGLEWGPDSPNPIRWSARSRFLQVYAISGQSGVASACRMIDGRSLPTAARHPRLRFVRVLDNTSFCNPRKIVRTGEEVPPES